MAETPSVDDYRRLRIVAGLSPKGEAAAMRGLPDTWFAVVVRKDDKTVGMAMVVP